MAILDTTPNSCWNEAWPAPAWTPWPREPASVRPRSTAGGRRRRSWPSRPSTAPGPTPSRASPTRVRSRGDLLRCCALGETSAAAALRSRDRRLHHRGPDQPGLRRAVPQPLRRTPPRRRAGHVRPGVGRGEIPADINVEVALDLLYGPLYHRLLHRHAPLTDGVAQAVVPPGRKFRPPRRPSQSPSPPVARSARSHECSPGASRGVRFAPPCAAVPRTGPGWPSSMPARTSSARVGPTLPRASSAGSRRGRPGSGHPRALDGVSALSWHASRLRVIPLLDVVGTVDATHDFDARFRPAAPLLRLAARWQRVALAHRQARPLPPISVIQRPEGYYVIDDPHRVSVARALRRRDIDAG